MQRLFAVLIMLAPVLAPAKEATAHRSSTGLSLPVEYYTLSNGLRVVLAHDDSIPTVTVGTYYHIGFRLEPRGRTGFAHLFEHLMFQETPNLKKGEADGIIAGNGGMGNGSTRFDYTNYFEVVPANVLEAALFVEADRMRGLTVSENSISNQKDVVKNEVRVNVLNRPYGGFPWLDLPQAAFENWHNAHNFYGELEEIDAATYADVKAFYDTYYIPSNAALVVAGAFDRSTIRSLIEREFGGLPSKPTPVRPAVDEPRQTRARQGSRTDALAPQPALAIGYQVPKRLTDDWFAFILLDVILLQGEESRLWQRVVTEQGFADSIDGGINLLGSAYDYEGPMLWSASVIHDANVPDSRITAEVESVIAEVQKNGVSDLELTRARKKLRSALYDLIGSPTRFGLVEILASTALFDNDPDLINRLEARLATITREQIRSVATRYLVKDNQTIFSLQAGSAKVPP